MVMKILDCTVKKKNTEAPPIKAEDKAVKTIPKIPTTTKETLIKTLMIVLAIFICNFIIPKFISFKVKSLACLRNNLFQNIIIMILDE